MDANDVQVEPVSFRLADVIWRGCQESGFNYWEMMGMVACIVMEVADMTDSQDSVIVSEVVGMIDAMRAYKQQMEVKA